jgi:molybdenum cofactor biosynthesis enzyme MoaA
MSQPIVPSYLTFQCDNHMVDGDQCAYCISKEKAGSQECSTLPKEAWLKFFKSLPEVYNIDFSGGEPFCYPEFQELIAKMPRLWNLTTNLNATKPQLEQMIQTARKTRNLGSVTASLHLRSNVKLEEFAQKIKMLNRANTFAVQVNYCAYPREDYIKLLPMLQEYFKKTGIHFHVEPYVCSPDRYVYTDEFKAFVQQYYQNDHRAFGWDSELPKNKICNAGCKGAYFIATNTGDCYRCNMHFFYTPEDKRKEGKGYLGNFTDGTFKWLTEASPCEHPCSYGNERENCSIYLPEENRFYLVGRSGKAGYT